MPKTTGHEIFAITHLMRLHPSNQVGSLQNLLVLGNFGQRSSRLFVGVDEHCSGDNHVASVFNIERWRR